MPRALDISTTASEDGRLPKGVSRRIRDHLALFAGREVRIRISSPKRSTQANAYLWACVYPAIQQGLAESGTAASCEAIHEIMKSRYLPARVIEAMGESLVLPGSSADLDSTAFYSFVESIRTDEDVLALGVVIPDPEPSYRSYKISDMR